MAVFEGISAGHADITIRYAPEGAQASYRSGTSRSLQLDAGAAAVHWGCMDRHEVGQARTQLPHWMHENGSMPQRRSFFSTVMQWQGHTRWHMPHRMHSSTSFSTCPFCCGYGAFV